MAVAKLPLAGKASADIPTLAFHMK